MGKRHKITWDHCWIFTGKEGQLRIEQLYSDDQIDMELHNMLMLKKKESR